MKKTLLAAVVMTAFGASTANAAITMTPEFGGGNINIGGEFESSTSIWNFGIETDSVALNSTTPFSKNSWTTQGGTTTTASVYTFATPEAVIAGALKGSFSNTLLPKVPTITTTDSQGNTVDLADTTVASFALPLQLNGQNINTATANIKWVMAAALGFTSVGGLDGVNAVTGGGDLWDNRAMQDMLVPVINAFGVAQGTSVDGFYNGWSSAPANAGNVFQWMSTAVANKNHQSNSGAGAYLGAISGVDVVSTAGKLEGTWKAVMPVTITYA
ncbi:hypothetical protein ACPV3S_20330 [Photobacterium damselae]|uniref:hypothetical protein n=1 Tax=Photobacterium damselae TaxID=38293 RepID=UPI0040684EDB